MSIKIICGKCNKPVDKATTEEAKDLILHRAYLRLHVECHGESEVRPLSKHDIVGWDVIRVFDGN